MGANGGKVLAVLGPTCTGKSDCAEWLARILDGEIVNADSMQVYKGFDIGSAKPSKEIRKEIPHHLIDLVDPHEEFNAALFKDTADAAIRGVWSRGHTPITVGGTGLYLRVLFHGIFPAPGDPRARLEIRDRYQKNPAETYEELRKIDPGYASAISHRDSVRVVRALEVHQISGITMSEWRKRHGFREQRYHALKIGLRRERGELYARINGRVEAMLEQGWIAEVESLIRHGYEIHLKPFQSIGYREIVLYLKGKIGYSDMVEQIRTATRHYAKRQITWFSKEKDIVWYEYPEQRERILENVTGFLS
jgi:tRNA dimethylallyltransferase